MLVNLPYNFPAIKLLKEEGIFIQPQSEYGMQNMQPIRLLVLNLMPLKVETETDLVRIFSGSPLPIEIDFLKLTTHQSKNTPQEHMQMFYKSFDEIHGQNYDGMIVTGAPVELLEYEAVSYWPELSAIFDWAHNNVPSTFYICWAAQAALYRFYGVPKHLLSQKKFGVFKHRVSSENTELTRSFDNEFYAPHSRYTEIRREDITSPELEIVSESDEAGLYIVVGRNGREIYVTGHSEYPPYRLHNEYLRDKGKGLDIEIPKHYYRDDNPSCKPLCRWAAHRYLLYNNWLNYYVYRSGLSDFKK
ncbi:homoserine O-succinyltransferase [Dysgonomonas sp. PH5-45]|uniref:homoserine O-succinyltransferase n=1 Tax=unclassified Dysgonomonas TaxID=2630389 RepID=UPI002475A896|nr:MULTISPECIES: homoserine O-succinyltransferase [unclassified Dysgonomonas]MDH6354444.1 homoserine O-succinyltransferase [Dysgonomonas sp. PH5-45]MDH6387343.1 homoserine O-succinyltransferase [Dysgonomonas sp. PH5-37]